MIQKVVCVEDSPIMQNIYKRVFKGVGFGGQVDIVQNGREALDYFQRLINQNCQTAYPDLIFLDLNMPVMGGWEFLDEFSKLPLEKGKAPKIVILTSSVDPRDKERAKNYPDIIDFLSKPLTFEMISDLEKKLNSRS